MYKPSGINTKINGNDFWNVAFNSGSGLLPTLIATTGYLGILAWLAFFVLLIISGTKSIFSSIKNGINWETMAFFVLSLYLFVSAFFYSTGPVIFLLAFAFAGVFIGLSASHSKNGEISFSFLNDHRKSFFSMLFIILLIIISAATSFKYLERFVSVSYFGKTLSATTIPEAITSINRAITLNSNDLYLRTYAQVYLVKFDSLIKKGDSLTEAEKADLQLSLDQAINGAQSATIYNPKSYLNFQALGSVYQSLASFGVKDAYSKAIEAYKTASTLNPLNPGLKLEIASSLLADGKTKDAKEYANLAISLKPDYINALIVLSQIAKKEGDNALALSYARTALSLSPLDKNLIQYVDSLKNTSSSSDSDTSSSTTDKKKS
jgi:tetratricopeptide (TPR) repeat protein